MNLKSFIAALIVCAPLTVGAQTTYLNCDFTNGIPDNFIQVDADGNEPSTDMKAIGFEKGKGWITYTLTKEDNNRVACSTSWYATPGTSSDWLITPQFTVNSADAVLNWAAKASDRRHRDGYTVYVSTDDSRDISTFNTSNPLFAVNAEESEWTRHSISLADYVGKRISVAFVNNSTNQSRLYIDDLFAGVSSTLYTLSGIPDVSITDKDIPVKGEVYTLGDESVEGFDVSFSCLGNTFTEHFDSVVSPGKRVPFQMAQSLTLTPNTPADWTLTVSHGNSKSSINGTTTALVKRVVCEEGTGCWCGWCIRGIVAIQNMTEKYGDRFIAIAVHNKDVMTNAHYDSIYTELNPGGFPKMMIDRKADYIFDPMYADAYTAAAFGEVSDLVGMDLRATLLNGGKISAATQLYYPSSSTMGNYKIAYVVLENDVHSTNRAYSQANAYSGGGSGVMGGYETKPTTVPASDMYYEDVARAYIDPVDNLESEFDLPASVSNVNNVEIVAMLINSDGQIVNGVKTKLDVPAGISTVRSAVNRTENDDYVSLSGVHFTHPSQPGIYIHNGRKIVVR